MDTTACTFFGHRECWNLSEAHLQSVLESLIAQGVSCFYVGNHGRFDAAVLQALRRLKVQHPQIRYAVVLSRLPDAYIRMQFSETETLLPEGIECVPPRFSVSWRNRWMLSRCGIVVSYITHSHGGAAQFAALAQRQGKTVINLAAL